MPHRETLNNANTAKIMTISFGHSNNFATLSLSPSLSQLLTYNSQYIIIKARAPALRYGFSCIRAREADAFLSLDNC